MDVVTDESVFDNTRPAASDGERIVGSPAVRPFWEEFFRRSPLARLEADETFATGDRCVVRHLTYNWLLSVTC